jgi:asparagine synthase (glutamine-hydrolysing)
VERRLDGSGEAHAFLSGGLDSSIIAVLLADRVDRLYTYTVGVEEAGDVKYSRKMVEFLDSEHTEYLFSEDDLVNILPNVIYHFESFTQDFMQAGMGTYLVSRLTAQSGSNYVFCGEGPDEVFGGYDDIKAVASDEELFRSVCVRITEELHEGGGTRLERMTAAQGLEYAVPFLDKSIVRFGLQLPVEWRVHPEEGIEKWIVRKAFEDLLPDEIVWRGKAPFARGAGALDTAVRVGERLGVTVPEAAGNDNPKFPLTKLDQLYYSVFQRFYNPAKMRRLFARWDPFRERF